MQWRCSCSTQPPLTGGAPNLYGLEPIDAASVDKVVDPFAEVAKWMECWWEFGDCIFRWLVGYGSVWEVVASDVDVDRESGIGQHRHSNTATSLLAIPSVLPVFPISYISPGSSALLRTYILLLIAVLLRSHLLD